MFDRRQFLEVGTMAAIGLGLGCGTAKERFNYRFLYRGYPQQVNIDIPTRLITELYGRPLRGNGIPSRQGRHLATDPSNQIILRQLIPQLERILETEGQSGEEEWLRVASGFVKSFEHIDEVEMPLFPTEIVAYGKAGYFAKAVLLSSILHDRDFETALCYVSRGEEPVLMPGVNINNRSVLLETYSHASNFYATDVVMKVFQVKPESSVVGGRNGQFEENREDGGVKASLLIDVINIGSAKSEPSYAVATLKAFDVNPFASLLDMKVTSIPPLEIDESFPLFFNLKTPWDVPTYNLLDIIPESEYLVPHTRIA
ncbi:hypothetical protein GOV07_00985 [Candidatus Woesearchaeota archaeon]|nr:hypothetical protein [Candidatus Woesearchaeota archaeon]